MSRQSKGEIIYTCAALRMDFIKNELSLRRGL